MTRTSTTVRFGLLLTMANGFLDAYTYLARGGVFANVHAIWLPVGVVFVTLVMFVVDERKGLEP